jgi:hypothetical protein
MHSNSTFQFPKLELALFSGLVVAATVVLVGGCYFVQVDCMSCDLLQIRLAPHGLCFRWSVFAEIGGFEKCIREPALRTYFLV